MDNKNNKSAQTGRLMREDLLFTVDTERSDGLSLSSYSPNAALIHRNTAGADANE